MSAIAPGGRMLVTGGTGFVGRALLAELGAGDRAAGREIVVAGRGPGCDVMLDLGRPETIAESLARCDPDIVVHLAGEASVAAAAGAAAETWRVNVAGTLELAAAFGARRPEGLFLFTSSAEVYGRAFAAGIADETTMPQPDTVYGRSKLAAERMLGDVLPATARLLVARPTNHIGPGQGERFAIPSFARQLAAAERAGAPARIEVGNLDAERDFMDVRDVVHAYALLLDEIWPAGARETFNVASGTVRPVRAMLDMLRAAARIDSAVHVDPARVRPAEIARAEVDARRLRERLGWAPHREIAGSLAEALDALRGAPDPTAR